MDPAPDFRPPTKSQFTTVLRLRNFMIFALSQAVSLFGDKLDYMALLAMIAFFYKAGSSQAISRLMVVVTLPVIIFGPFAGVLVDRWNRRKVLIACDAARMVLVALIPLVMLKTHSLLAVYVVVFFVFLFGLFFNTSRLSIVPNLVAHRRLLAANSFMNLVGRLTTFLGVLLGGFIVDWAVWRHLRIEGWSAGFYVDSLSFLVSVGALLVMSVRLKPRVLSTDPHGVRTVWGIVGRELRQTRVDFREAYRVIIRRPPITLAISSTLMLVLLGGAVLVLFVPIIQTTLRLGTRGVGIVSAIGSVGLVLGSTLTGVFGHRVRKKHIILWGFLLLGAMLIVGANARSFLALAPLALCAGFIIAPIMISQDTMLHETTPEDVRGRVFSAKEWVLQFTFAATSLAIGFLVGVFHTRTLLLAIGGLVVLLAAAGLIVTRHAPIG